MKGWTCRDNRFKCWTHQACYEDSNPAPTTSMTNALYMTAAACGRAVPMRKIPKLTEGHELMLKLRTLEARRRDTRDRVQRAVYSNDIIRLRRRAWRSSSRSPTFDGSGPKYTTRHESITADLHCKSVAWCSTRLIVA